MGYNGYNNNRNGAYNSRNNGNNRNGGGFGNKGAKRVNSVNEDFLNPYAFVPFTNRFYFLNDDEVDQLGTVHDVPLEDGFSGKITVSFRAEMPFCICGTNDGHNVNINGKFFIPGTSVKGMVRNVFEILTMSNSKNGIADTRHSIRDLTSKDYKIKDGEQKSGILFKYNNRYYISECDNEKKSYDDIIKEGHADDKIRQAASVADKYKTLKEGIVWIDDEDYYNMWFFSNKMQNKKHEYLFLLCDVTESSMIPIEEDVWDDFIFIHEQENDNKSWKFWKQRLNNVRKLSDIMDNGFESVAPCFFRTKEVDGRTVVKDLGFAYLYRQPYDRTTRDFVPGSSEEENIDLTQAVFGYTAKKSALRGRVQFTNAFIENARELPICSEVLSSPKTSFSPFYLKQDQPDRLVTYFSRNAQLAGTKRYLVQSKIVRNESTGSLSRDSERLATYVNNNVRSSFVPLDKGATFETEIYFHNLHEYELGALLASISFANEPGCYHQLGHGKPYGYGKMKVENVSVEYIDDKSTTKEHAYNCFVEKICKECGFKDEREWKSSFSYLLTLAKGDGVDKPVRYPRMRGNNGNEYVAIKNAKGRYNISNFNPRQK